MPLTPPPRTCDAPGPNGARCYLLADHTGTFHRGIASWEAAAPADDAPTERIPPIRDTVRRRPPAAVRELRGPDLLRALADELDRDGFSLDDL